jgi:hypothetical protein
MYRGGMAKFNDCDWPDPAWLELSKSAQASRLTIPQVPVLQAKLEELELEQSRAARNTTADPRKPDAQRSTRIAFYPTYHP